MGKSIQHLLAQARCVHHQLLELYDCVSTRAEKQKVYMLLEDMRRHEKSLESCMAELEDSASDDQAMVTHNMAFEDLEECLMAHAGQAFSS